MPKPIKPSLGSPFFSVLQKDPNRPAAKLRTLILSDLQAVPQRVAQLAQWLIARDHAFTVDLILVIGVSRPAPDCVTNHHALAEQANDSATITQLENICPRVIYVPALHEHPSAWETTTNTAPRLTVSSHNAVAGPFHVAPDLYVAHRRFADGISDKPMHYLPLSWRSTIYAKLSRPPRFRVPSRPSAIIMCSSQLPDAHTSKSKAIGLLRTVRSLLSLNRSAVPKLDFILAIAPPKMQRVPSSSTVFRHAERTLDPGSFADGYFCLATFVRPEVWDPLLEPNSDDEQIACESAWEVNNITRYNLDRKLSEDNDADALGEAIGDDDDRADDDDRSEDDEVNRQRTQSEESEESEDLDSEEHRNDTDDTHSDSNPPPEGDAHSPVPTDYDILITDGQSSEEIDLTGEQLSRSLHQSSLD